MILLRELGKLIAIPFVFSIALVVVILEVAGVVKAPGLKKRKT